MGWGEPRKRRGKTYWIGRYKKLDGSKGTLPDEFTTQNAAKKAGTAEEVKLRTQGNLYVEPSKARVTFGAWVAEWKTTKRQTRARARTQQQRRRLLRLLLLPQWEHTPLDSFNWLNVETWADGVDTHDAVTVQHALSLLSTILTAAVDGRRLAVNPIAGRTWEPSETAEKDPDKEDRKKPRPLATPAQALAIASRLDSEAARLMVLIAQYTGMRYGEICAMHRDNALVERHFAVGRDRRTFHVLVVDPLVGEWCEASVEQPDGTETTVLSLEPPKSEKSARDVYLPDFLVDRIQAHKERWPHEYLFTTPRGVKWRRSNWNRLLGPAADGRGALPEKSVEQAPWLRIVWDLWERIDDGDLAPGAELPTVTGLAAEHGVSRGTVQRAVDYLAEAGQLSTQRGRRTRVAEMRAAFEGPPAPRSGAAWAPIVPDWRLHCGRHWLKSIMDEGDQLGALPTAFTKAQLGHAYSGIDGVYGHVLVGGIDRYRKLMQQLWEEAVPHAEAILAGIPTDFPREDEMARRRMSAVSQLAGEAVTIADAG